MMMFQVQKLHASEPKDTHYSLKDEHNSDDHSISSPSSGSLQGFQNGNVDDLISCITTWQKNPRSSNHPTKRSCKNLRQMNHLALDLGYQAHSGSMQIPPSAKRQKFSEPAKCPETDDRNKETDISKQKTEVTSDESITAPPSMKEESNIDSVVHDTNKNIGGFESLGDLNTTTESLKKEEPVVIDKEAIIKEIAQRLEKRRSQARPTLFYLHSKENIGCNSISDSEDNPFMTVEVEGDQGALITAKDIMTYGRNDSFQEMEEAKMKHCEQEASKALKDVSINCQIDNIRSSGGVRLRRNTKDKSERGATVEEYARIAAEFEKVRGVCYCRSDNSWTAWWTEKGRNRKKAFKVSLFGFEEARSRAIAHRLSIEEKMSDLRSKHTQKDSVSELSVDQDTAAVTSPVGSRGEQNSPVTPVGSLSPKVKHVSRMHTRSYRLTELDLNATDNTGYTDPFSTYPKDHEGERQRDFVQGCRVTPPQMVMSPRNYKRSLVSLEEGEVCTPEFGMKEATSVEPTQIDVETNDDIRTSINGTSSIDTATATPRPHYTSPASTPRDRITLNRDFIDKLTLDQESSRIMDLVMSNLAFGGRRSGLPAGESVRILPDILTDPDGNKLTVIILRHK